MIAGATRGKGGTPLVRHLTSRRGQVSNLVDVRNLSADNTNDALNELVAGSLHGKTDRPVHHLHVDPPVGFDTPQTREHFLNLYEVEFGLQDSPRFIQEHIKNGRTHWHVVYSLVLDDGKIVDLSHDRARREKISRRTEYELGMPLVQGAHSRAVFNAFQKEGLNQIASAMVQAGHITQDKPIAQTPQERAQNERTEIATEEVSALAFRAFQTSDNGSSFHSALEAFGLKLAQGDKGAVLVDAQGGAHSLTRAIGTASRLAGNRISAGTVKARIAGLTLKPLKEIQNECTNSRRDIGKAKTVEGITGHTQPSEKREDKQPGFTPASGSSPALGTPERGNRGKRPRKPAKGDLGIHHAQPNPYPERNGTAEQSPREPKARQAYLKHQLRQVVGDGALKAMAEELREFTRKLALQNIERQLVIMSAKAVLAIQKANETPEPIRKAQENLEKAKKVETDNFKAYWSEYEKTKAILNEEKPTGFLAFLTGKTREWEKRQTEAQQQVERFRAIFDQDDRKVERAKNALKQAERHRPPKPDTSQAIRELALVRAISLTLEKDPDLAFRDMNELIALEKEKLKIKFQPKNFPDITYLSAVSAHGTDLRL